MVAAGCWSVPADAHLIDEIAESLLCDIETSDRAQIRATWYLEAARVEAYFDAAEQIGQDPRAQRRWVRATARGGFRHRRL